jgi:hypothetical protein
MSEKPQIKAFSSRQAALAALTIAWRLGRLDGAARDRLNVFCAAQPAFAALADAERDAAIALAQDIADAPEGFDTLLDMLAQSLPPTLAATAYSLCADYIALYGTISPEEMRFLDRLGEALAIDRLSRAALDRAAQARAVLLGDK